MTMMPPVEVRKLFAVIIAVFMAGRGTMPELPESRRICLLPIAHDYETMSEAGDNQALSGGPTCPLKVTKAKSKKLNRSGVAQYFTVQPAGRWDVLGLIGMVKQLVASF